jgi:short-subunit dehydrogenase
MGYFDERSIDPLMGNLECNAAAGIRISHMMYSRMIAEGRRGCLAFTSSSAWFIPAPYATMYAATKAMLSNFAVSLSIEARNHGVDVCVVHPSYTHTNLYENNPKIGVLKLLAKFGWTGDDVANVLFESVGRVVVRDAGAYSVLTNLLGRVIDSGSLAKIIMPFRHGMAPSPQSAGRKLR